MRYFRNSIIKPSENMHFGAECPGGILLTGSSDPQHTAIHCEVTF